MKSIATKWLPCLGLLAAVACGEGIKEPLAQILPPKLTTDNLSGTGLELPFSEGTCTFTLDVDAPWEITKDAGWFVVTPNRGKAGEKIEVSILVAPNTGGARTGSFTIRANSGNNLHPVVTEKKISISQVAYVPPVDSHPAGHVFFNENFEWIPTNWVSPYTKYGWPSVKIDATNYNEVNLATAAMAEVVAGKGYDHKQAYARWEGWIKLGNASTTGFVAFPPLSGIDAGKFATLLVRFDGALYSSPGGAIDRGDDEMMRVAISGPGTFGESAEKEAAVKLDNVWSWKRYSLVVKGATAETSLTFGKEQSLKNRLYLDNVSVSRADDGNALVPEPETIATPLDKEFVNTSAAALFTPAREVVAQGGTLTATIRVNAAWRAETDCDWLTITAVRIEEKLPVPSTDTAAANCGATLSEGVATVPATGLPYNNTRVKVGQNAGEARTGHIIVHSGAEEIFKITITQAAGL